MANMDTFGNALVGVGKEVDEKLDWAQAFIGKYANILLTIGVIYALAKIFKIKVQV